jgi:hypothetical protein
MEIENVELDGLCEVFEGFQPDRIRSTILNVSSSWWTKRVRFGINGWEYTPGQSGSDELKLIRQEIYKY